MRARPRLRCASCVFAPTDLENSSNWTESFPIRSAQSYLKREELFTEGLYGLEPFHFGGGEVAPLPRFQTAQSDGTHANPAQIPDGQAHRAAHFPALAAPSFANRNH